MRERQAECPGSRAEGERAIGGSSGGGSREECKSGAAGTIIVAEKAPEILEPGRVL